MTTKINILRVYRFPVPKFDMVQLGREA
jgi:hypothetical protein